jgi:hypothetical protein
LRGNSESTFSYRQPLSDSESRCGSSALVRIASQITAHLGRWKQYKAKSDHLYSVQDKTNVPNREHADCHPTSELEERLEPPRIPGGS